MMRRMWMVGVVAVLALAWGLDARAATCSFEGTVNDQWSLADNWASSQKPVANDDVVVAAACRVNEAPPRLSSMLVSSSTATLPPGTALLVTNGITMAGGTLKGEPGTPLPTVRDNDAGQPKTAVNVIRITGHGVRLEHLDVAGGTSDTIYAEGTSSNRYTGIVIEDVFVHDTGDEGIQLKYADGPKYLRCRATDTGGDAFNMDNTINGLIENCEAWGALGRHTLGHGGIYFQDCISTTARGNFFHDINMLPEHAANRCDAGIQLYKCSGTMTLYNNVIVNSFFYGCEYNAYRGSGIVIYALQNNDSTTIVKVQHNTIWNNQGKNSAGQTRGHGIHWNQKYYTGGYVKLIDNILGYPVGASGSYGKSIFIEKASGLTLAGQIGWSLLPNTIQTVPEIPVDATCITDRQPAYVGTDMTLRKSWKLQSNSPGRNAASDGLDMGAIFPVVEFLIPDETGALVSPEFVTISAPRPTVSLDALSASDVTIGANAASVVLRGQVRDPIADNFPAGKGADIAGVSAECDGVEVDGSYKTITRTDDGTPTFWRQHPYKGTFDPITVNVPLTEGTHTIRALTSENAANRVGYDEVLLTLTKRIIPGAPPSSGSTLTENIFIPNNPSPWVADTMKFYYGEREPQDGDPVLTEKTAEAQFALAWGTAGTGNGQFNAPADVAVDASGNVYVLDSGNDRVEKFDKAGTFLLAWGTAGTEDGQFSQPKGLAVDSSGNVYVADTGNNRVQKFTSAGVFVLKFGAQGSGDGQFSSPTDVATNAGGNIYVVDRGNHRIQKFALDGSFIAKWGSEGAGDGQFASPTSLAVASDNTIYVTDTANNRVQKFSSAGTFLLKWGGLGATWAKLDHPTGVAFDNANVCLYVCDSGNGRVQRFEPDGTFLMTWGEAGTDNGKFSFAMGAGIAISEKGRVYVADTGNDRVQKFLVSEATLIFRSAWGTAGSGNGQFTQPADVIVDASGNIYVLDSGNNRVQKFDSAGTFVLTWGTNGAGDGQFSQPKGIGVDSGGNIYVSDTGNNRIQKFTAAGTFVMKFGSQGAGDGQFAGPADVAVDVGGDIYVVDQNNHRIQKFSSNGTFAAKWGSQGAEDGQFSLPRSLALDSAGNVFVTDSGNHRVQKFSAAGTFILKWGSQGTDSGEFSTPCGICIDGANGIYVCDAGNNRLQRFAANGAFLASWGSAGVADGQFSFSAGAGIAIDQSGVVFVSDSGNNRIQKLCPSEGALLFRGIVAGEAATIAIDNFTGLSAQADTLTAKVSFVFYRDGTMTFAAAFAETGLTTGIFRASLSCIPPSPPATLVENIYMSVAPTANVADSIKLYSGQRDPLDSDPTFTEKAGFEDSLAFWGYPATDTLQGRMKISEFNGLTDGIDTLVAEYATDYGDYLAPAYKVVFTETGPSTKLFRATVVLTTIPPEQYQAQWAVGVGRGCVSDQNCYRPLTVRVRGIPDEETPGTLNMAGMEYDLEKGSDGHWYLKGGSNNIIIIVREGDPPRLVKYAWDKATLSLKKQDIEADKLKAELQKWQADRDTALIFADLTIGNKMRTDDKGTSDTKDDMRFIYPSVYDSEDLLGTDAGFLKYDVQLANLPADSVTYARVRVLAKDPRTQAATVVFEDDITEKVKQAPTSTGLTFKGLTSPYKVKQGASWVDTMTVDADGEANGINDQGRSDLQGTWKFIDPGTEGGRRYTAEVDLKYKIKVKFVIPGAGEGEQTIDQSAVSQQVFEARVRHVALVEPKRNGPIQWWETAKKVNLDKRATTPDKPEPVLHTTTDKMVFNDAFRCLTPRGKLLYGYHGNYVDNPNSPFHDRQGAGGIEVGDDGMDLFGIVYLCDAQGVPHKRAGFIGNGYNTPTTLPGQNLQPHDLGSVPRAHKIDISLMSCWSAHKSNNDDSGPSVVDTLWEVVNRRCSSGIVGGSWGLVGERPGTASVPQRPRGDDEGAGGQDDVDNDNNPSTGNDDPTKADPGGDWVERASRAKVQ